MRNVTGRKPSFGGSGDRHNHLRDDDASSVGSDDSTRDGDDDIDGVGGRGFAKHRHRASNANESGGRRPRTEMNIAPPKWFLAKDAADTGLESMFDEIFTLKTPVGREVPQKGKGWGLLGRH